MSRPERQRRREGRRLAWYGTEPDDDHWFRHWERKLTDDWLQKATARDPHRDHLLGPMLDWLPTDGTVLEAGCGAGDYVAALAARGIDVEGLESSERLVDLVNSRYSELNIGHGDALAIDRPDGHYAAYVSIGVVEHRREGPEPFLTEAHRVLRSGGTAVIAVPGFGPTRQAITRVRRSSVSGDAGAFYQYAFSASELVELIEAAGFEVIEHRFVGAYRMLVEEVPGFLEATNRRGGSLVRSGAERLAGKRDGHMVVVRAVRP